MDSLNARPTRVNLTYIPITPSPSQALTALAPLLHKLAPILESRITSPDKPPWMDDATAKYLLSLSDNALEALERRPHLPPYPSCEKDLPKALTCIRSLAAPLQAAFPYIQSPPLPMGRSSRRSKSRPRPAKRAQICAVTSLLSTLLQRTGKPVKRVVDVGAGHAHLSACLSETLHPPLPVVAFERDPHLVATATTLHLSGAHARFRAQSKSMAAPNSRLTVMIGDALDPTAGTPLAEGDALVGLHACGALGDSLVCEAGPQGVRAVLLVSCCLQKISSLMTFRYPLSEAARSNAILRKHLTLSRSQLGATNSARGYERQGDLIARETRHAIRILLASAGHPVSRIGNEVVGISRHAMKAGLHAIIPELVALHNIDRPSDEEVSRCARNAHAEYRIMRALAQPRAFASALLEMAVVLDRAARLEQAGFFVSTCRIWPDDISPRNLSCVAWR